MANWNDKQLRSHKRAQGYISATGATLGIAALGAAGAKTGLARRGTNKLAEAAARSGNPQRAVKIKAARKKIGSKATPLTIGSAGVGGVGGYNFAAIQSQESRKRVSKSLSVWGVDHGINP